MGETYISINITNNTNGTIPLNIMGNPADLADIGNQTTQYRWDVTGLTFGTENFVSVDYRANAIQDFTTYVAPLLVQSLQGVLDALNGLYIGSFFSYTSGGNTYITNYNNDYVFGDINIYDNSGSIVAWSIDCIGTTGFNDINTGFFSQNESNPFTGTSYPPIGTSGQNVDITGTTSNQPSTKVKIYNQTTSTYIVNAGLGSGVAYSYSFNAVFGNNYLITVTDY